MPRIIDIATPRAPGDVPKHLLDLSSKCDDLERRINNEIPRSDRSLVLANFASYISQELHRLSKNYQKDTTAFVWSTRNLFEVDLIIRHVMSSDKNFKDWLGQSLEDERIFINNVLTTSSENSQSENAIRLSDRLKELEGLAKNTIFHLQSHIGWKKLQMKQE